MKKRRSRVGKLDLIIFIEDFYLSSRFILLSSQVSVLCRILRIGNASIREVCLRIIRNFSLKASIGTVLLSSGNFQANYHKN